MHARLPGAAVGIQPQAGLALRAPGPRRSRPASTAHGPARQRRFVEADAGLEIPHMQSEMIVHHDLLDDEEVTLARGGDAFFETCAHRSRPCGKRAADARGPLEGAHEVRQVREADVERHVGHDCASDRPAGAPRAAGGAHQILVRRDPEHAREQPQEVERAETRLPRHALEIDGLVGMLVEPERRFDRAPPVAPGMIAGLRSDVADLAALAWPASVDEARRASAAGLVRRDLAAPAAAASASSAQHHQLGHRRQAPTARWRRHRRSTRPVPAPAAATDIHRRTRDRGCRRNRRRRARPAPSPPAAHSPARGYDSRSTLHTNEMELRRCCSTTASRRRRSGADNRRSQGRGSRRYGSWTWL